MSCPYQNHLIVLSDEKKVIKKVLLQSRCSLECILYRNVNKLLILSICIYGVMKTM